VWDRTSAKKVLFFCLKNIDFLERAERDFFITDNHITVFEEEEKGRESQQEILNQPKGADFRKQGNTQNLINTLRITQILHISQGLLNN
jgi:hypothetical protein